MANKTRKINLEKLKKFEAENIKSNTDTDRAKQTKRNVNK